MGDPKDGEIGEPRPLHHQTRPPGGSPSPASSTIQDPQPESPPGLAQTELRPRPLLSPSFLPRVWGAPGASGVCGCGRAAIPTAGRAAGATTHREAPPSRGLVCRLPEAVNADAFEKVLTCTHREAARRGLGIPPAGRSGGGVWVSLIICTHGPGAGLWGHR